MDRQVCYWPRVASPIRTITLYRIKICGITRVPDAHLVVLAGADAIGLNFYPKSSRFVDVAAAEKITTILRDRASKIGVFVNATTAEIVQITSQLKLDGIQLHGDEPPEMLADLPDVQIVRAFRFG